MGLPKKTAAYIGGLFLVSIFLFYYLYTTYRIDDIKGLIFWAFVAIITESLIILLPNGAGVSVGFAITLASMIVGGPLYACIVSSIGVMLRVLKISAEEYSYLFNTPIYITIFNVSQSIIITSISGIIYILAGGKTEGQILMIAISSVLLSYIILNSIVTAVLLSLHHKQPFINTWVNNLKDILPSLAGVGTIGVILALAYISYGKWAVLLFFGPLLLARFSFKLYIDMRNVYMSTIQALNKSMEAKDAYTSGHAGRVQEYAVKLAEAAKLPLKKIENIKTAAILHDIGKIGVDDNILKKPGKLTEEEYNSIKQHPTIGANILQDVDFLKEVAQIIKYHHERYDGGGYPDGLGGDQIPIEAAILSLADVYDAMTSDRPYRKGMSKSEALEEIRCNTGTQFHPELAEKFIRIMKEC